jgi:hypothetical protein
MHFIVPDPQRPPLPGHRPRHVRLQQEAEDHDRGQAPGKEGPGINFTKLRFG